MSCRSVFNSARAMQHCGERCLFSVYFSVLFLIVFSLFPALAHAYISVPDTDADGSFLVTWTDVADETCAGQALPEPAYELTQGNNTYTFASADQKYKAELDKPDGVYQYSLSVRRCNSSSPGGYRMASAGSASVHVGVDGGTLKSFNLSAPSHSDTRGFEVTWNALNSSEKREGICYQLRETAYPFTSADGVYQQRTLHDCAQDESTYFRHFPLPNHFYEYSLCKRTSYGYQTCASVRTHIIDDITRHRSATPNAVGSSPYSADVDRKGNAHIEIPLKALPGDNGLEPALSIAYNSGGANQRLILGKPKSFIDHGWSLSGFSQIHRCRRGDNDEVVEDNSNPTGVPDPLARPRIQFDDSDTLCIDDQKLVLTAGEHLRAGAVYRTFIETYKRIEIKAGAGYGGDTDDIWFEVRQPDGRITHYGQGVGARLRYAVNYPYLAWAMGKVIDSFGTELTYTFTNPAPITGAPQLSNTIQNYSNRPEESTVRFIPQHIVYPGGQVSFDYRYSAFGGVHLELVQMKDAAGNTRRTYTVGYNGDGVTSIQECAGSRCLTPLTFDYNTGGGPSHPTKPELAALHDGVGASVFFDYASIRNQCYQHITEEHLQDTPGEVFPELLPNFVEQDIRAPLSSANGNGTKYFRPHDGDTDLFCRARSGQSFITFVGRSVSAMRKTDGIGGEGNWTYRYGDPGFNSHYGRGFVGYSQVRVTDEQTGVTTYTQYALHEHVAGRVQEARVYAQTYDRMISDVGVNDGTAELISHTTAQHHVIAIDHGNNRFTYHPYERQSHHYDYEDGIALGMTFTETDYTFNQGFPANKSTRTGYANRRLGVFSTESNTLGSYRKDSYDRIRHTVDTQEDYTHYTSATDWRIRFLHRLTRTTGNGDHVYVLDSKTQVTEYAPWQATMAIATETRFPGDPTLELTTGHTYDSAGNRTSSTVSGANVAPRTVHFSDYSRGVMPQFVTNALGHETQYVSWNPNFRKPEAVIDPNGRVTITRYDVFERPVETVDHDGNVTTVVYEPCAAVYDCDGAQGVASYVKITTSNIAPQTREVHDIHNRVIRTSTQGLNSNEWITVDTVYNARGLVAQQSLPYRNLSDRRFITYSYDNLGRKTRETRADGSYTRWQYAKANAHGVPHRRVIAADHVLDADGNFLKARVKAQYLDAAGRLGLSIDGYTSDAAFTWLGALDSSATVTTSYKYDSHNNPNWVRVSGGSDGETITLTEYDAAGNRVVLVGPNVGRVESEYSALGEVIHTRDAAGNETNYHYDVLGRLEYKLAGDDYYRFDYDSSHGKGLLSHALHNDTYTIDYSYTDGRLRQISESIRLRGQAPVSASSRYTYDAQGRTATQEYSSGRSVRYGYSSTGYQTDMRDDDTGELLHTVETIGAYGPEQFRFGNGATTEQTYDINTGFLSELTHNNASGNAFHQQNYRWHSSGNMQTRGYSHLNQSANHHQEHFTYDAHDRLTRAQVYVNNSHSRTLDYAYNRLGNLQQKTSTRGADDQVSGYQYGTQRSGCSAEPGPHAVSYAVINGTGTRLCYDAKGQISRYIRSGADTFVAYNHTGQPVQITVGDALTDPTPEAENTFRYGPNGQRYYQKRAYQKDGSTKVEHVYYFADGTEYTVHEGTTSHPKIYKTHAGGSVQLTRTFNNVIWENNTQYLHKDHLGSIVAITDDTLSNGNSNGDATHTMAFEPFG